MALVWVVCGAGKGAGKSHLARALCGVLPRAAYAKMGHGRRRPGGPEPFFGPAADLRRFVAAQSRERDHVVVESNAWARQGRGDLIIFLDGPTGRLDARSDVRILRERAHIKVGPGQSPRTWMSVLRRCLGEPKLCGAVLSLLKDQVSFLKIPALQVRSKVWLGSRRGRVFGSGIARMLGGIERLGSLREAAKACGLSYRHAWGLLKTAAWRLGRPLVRARPGGRGGGGATLTRDGRLLAEIFGRLSLDVEDYANRRFAGYIRGMVRS